MSMSLAIISTSLREQNGSQKTAVCLQAAANRAAVKSSIVTIAPFNNLFTGEYLHFSNVNSDQFTVMDTIRAADSLVFVVPTYFKSIPGGLSNFFDIVRERSLYEHKAIAFVASNHKNQDFGARHAMLVIQGILEFFDAQAAIVPDIKIINPEKLDSAVAQQGIADLLRLRESYRPVAQTI